MRLHSTVDPKACLGHGVDHVGESVGAVGDENLVVPARGVGVRGTGVISGAQADAITLGATSPRLDRDLLMWVGYPTTLIGRQLEKDQTFPSFFLSERDPNPHAIKPYLPKVRQKEPQHDELCLVADENLVALRYGLGGRGQTPRTLVVPPTADVSRVATLGLHAGWPGGTRLKPPTCSNRSFGGSSVHPFAG